MSKIKKLLFFFFLFKLSTNIYVLTLQASHWKIKRNPAEYVSIISSVSTGGYVGRDTLYSRYAFGPVCFIDRARVVGTHAERETKATAGKIIGLGIDRRALRNCPRRASSLRLAAAAVQKRLGFPAT